MVRRPYKTSACESLAALHGRDQSPGFCGPVCRFPPGVGEKYSGTASSSKKRQIADKENLPYFRIWKTSIYSNRPIDDYIRGTQTLEQGIDSLRLEG
ncbi:hypothetical protein F2Q69_00048440 [Brassica cretica]|uniref:Uncharacterized protein n=1 Tax=Brassica cretica TaxID=69181 RepID=A0A8S9PZH7_BRACR|nr:hypothetical protein F2Q69_00048440 [Brassica cretica]